MLLPLILNLFSLLIFIIVLILTLANHSRMEWGLFNCSYYIILTLVLMWAFSIYNLWRQHTPNVAAFFKIHKNGIIFCLILTSIIFISIPKHFRVLNDETNLLSVARSMTYEKTVRNVTEARWHYEVLWPSAWSIEKRPFLFPFFASIVHTICGYRVANVFALNSVVLWGFLFLLYLLIRYYLGEILAFAALFLVAAQPIITLSATSVSCEIFNLLFIIASLLSLRFFLRNPNPAAFTVLILNLVMLSNIRYESGLFLAITVAILLMSGYFSKEFLKLKWLPLLPFFFLPWLWQRILTVGDGDLPGGTWLNAFKFHYILQNIKIFCKCVFDVGGQAGYGGLVSIAGAIALLWLIVSLFKKNRRLSKEQSVFLVIFTISILASFFVALLYYATMTDHPMNGRFYFPFLVILSILPAFFISEMMQNKGKELVLAAAFTCFIFYHPMAMKESITSSLLILREFRFIDNFLRMHPDRNVLIITGRPGQIVVYNYGAITYHTANKEVDDILEQYKNHLFKEIYVVQPIAYNNLAPLKFSAIDPRYHLETMSELQICRKYFLRISRVKVTDS